MNFWKKIGEFIFGKPVIVKDDFFGEMIDAGSYFECQKLFHPTGKIVVLHIDKIKDGISKESKEFFKNLEKNYDQLIEDISPALEERVREWITNYKISDFKKEFQFEFLSISKMEESIFEWEIVFDAINDLQHTCFVIMKGDKVQNIRIDG